MRTVRHLAALAIVSFGFVSSGTVSNSLAQTRDASAAANALQRRSPTRGRFPRRGGSVTFFFNSVGGPSVQIRVVASHSTPMIEFRGPDPNWMPGLSGASGGTELDSRFDLPSAGRYEIVVRDGNRRGGSFEISVTRADGTPLELFPAVAD